MSTIRKSLVAFVADGPRVGPVQLCSIPPMALRLRCAAVAFSLFATDASAGDTLLDK